MLEDKQVRAMWAAIRRIEAAVKMLQANDRNSLPASQECPEDDAPGLIGDSCNTEPEAQGERQRARSDEVPC